MSAIAAFVLGLFIGWIIEWIIDWIYWRRRVSAPAEQEALLRERLKTAEARSADLDHQLEIQKANQSTLQEKLTNAETELNTLKREVSPQAIRPTRTEVIPGEPEAALPGSVATAPIVHDDLVVIKGIGPVIAAKLNQAGIYSFADLAALTPERLRELVGKMISQLADEESIIEQARKLAAEKSQGR